MTVDASVLVSTAAARLPLHQWIAAVHNALRMARFPELAALVRRPRRSIPRSETHCVAGDAHFSAILSAARFLSKGAVRKARQAIASHGVLQLTDDIVHRLKLLYPVGPATLGMVDQSDSRLAPTIVLTDVDRFIASRSTATGGGLSGWCYDDWKKYMANATDNGKAALVNVLSDIVAGRIREADDVAMLMPLRGIAIAKPDGSPRPVGVGESLVQMAAGILAALYRDQFRILIGNAEFGVGARGGTEALAHAVRAFAQAGMVIVKIDITNAFNTVHREAVLRAVRQIPGLAPFVFWRYRQPCDVTYSCHVTERTVTIPVRQGVIQGDPLGGLLYSLTQAPAYESTRAAHPGVRLLSLHDDGYIVGTDTDVFDALATLRDNLSQMGLQLNAGKSAVYAQVVSVAVRARAELENVRVADGIMVAGSPVGSMQFMLTFAGTAANRICSELRAIEQAVKVTAWGPFQTLQTFFRLVRMCVPQQLTHLMRTTPPDATRDAARQVDAEVDAVVFRCMAALPDDPGKEAASRRLHLPLHKGGGGVMGLSNLGDAAYAGSWALISELVTSVLRGSPAEISVDGDSQQATPWLQALRASVLTLRERWACDVTTLPEVEDLLARSRSKLQSACSLSVAGKLHDEAIRACVSPEEEALLRGCAHPASRAWLTALTNTRDAAVDNRDFAGAMRLRLGLALGVMPARCPFCKVELGEHERGLHAFVCRQTRASLTTRHTAVCYGLRRGLKQVPGISIRKEPRVSEFARHRPGKVTEMRADLAVIDGLGAETWLLDPTVSHTEYAARRRGAGPLAMTQAEHDKFQKYNSCFDLTPGLFVPFAFETSGALGPMAMEFLCAMRQIARDREHPLTLFRMLVHASVALQRGNGRIIAHYFAG